MSGASAKEAADRLIAAGNRAEDEGRPAEACARYREAIAAAPGYARAHLNLGIALEALGQVDEAARCYGEALAKEPANPYAHYNLGKLLFVRGTLPEAERHLREAIAARPGFAEAQVVLSNLLDAQGNFEAAAAALEPALRLRPDYARAWHNYALALTKIERLADAEAAARRSLELDPAFLPTYEFLGDLLRTVGRHEEAADVFRAARARAGGGIEWAQAELHALNHSDRIGEEALFARHREVAAQLEGANPARFAPFANPADPERRLRLGYVSRDFSRHPVGWFMMPVLQRHDRSRFEVFCYSTGARSDEVTAQARALADHWRDASRMPASELADAIHRDRIDILVDLLGHCLHSSLAAFAQQPAPVQVGWLGYLNTTGLTRIRYRLTDARCDPPGDADRRHTETLVRLPHSQWCYRPITAIAHRDEPPLKRNGHVTFGSFNHMLKLSPGLLAMWARILAQMPEARLVVLGVPQGMPGERLLSDLAAGGISSARVALVPPLPLDDYFKSFDAVDLALDSTPYSGGTTTCDTLWMGVPVVTLSGARSASRSAASILSTLGLGEWVATTPEDYVRLAVALASDAGRLAAARASLRERMRASPIMDEPGFLRELEAAYRGMWRAWCEGERR